jgi:hypothetical protein
MRGAVRKNFSGAVGPTDYAPALRWDPVSWFPFRS